MAMQALTPAIERLISALEALPPRRRVAVLLNAGVPADYVIGTGDCLDHNGWSTLAEITPLTFDLTTLWCRHCWKWYRRHV